MLNIRFGALRAGAASCYCSGSAKKMQILAALALQNWSLRKNLRPQKIVYGRKKLKEVKWQNLAKSSRKEAGNIFTNI
jgi:hypothetical protein